MSMNQQRLAEIKRRFEDTGIPLRLATEPFVRSSRWQIDRTALLMDIRRVKRVPAPGEAVVLWPGEAEFDVVSADRRFHQVILTTVERERRFLIRGRSASEPRWNLRTIPADTRHFLVGRDEAHLFIARLPEAARSVAQAHHILAPGTVLTSRREGHRVPRQGEHFFLPTDGAERAAIALALEEGAVPAPGIVHPSRDGHRVLRRGKPHRATECLVVAGRQFVRGVIRHPDHAPLRLRDWMRPEVNREHEAAFAQGVTWVD